MNPDDHARALQIAKVLALELRRQAINDFWSALSAAIRRSASSRPAGRARREPHAFNGA